MSSVHGSEILSGNAMKKPHGMFGRLLHSLENRYFVLRIGADGVPELAYYENAQSVDPKHQKGVLYLDHDSVNITVHKHHNEMQIANASKASHQGHHHVVQDLMLEFSTRQELEKWNAALEKCIKKKSQISEETAPPVQVEKSAEPKVHVPIENLDYVRIALECAADIEAALSAEFGRAA
jgi:hypothetical protein